MTTIAYSRGILAGDGRVSDPESGHIWTDNCRKVFRAGGCLFGSSGDDEAGEILLKQLRRGVKLPKLYDGAEVMAVLVHPDGKIFLTEGAVWIPWHEPYIALGSGKRGAMAALRLGHDAITAVKAGAEGDAFSGGKITFVKFSKGPSSRK